MQRTCRWLEFTVRDEVRKMRHLQVGLSSVSNKTDCSILSFSSLTISLSGSKRIPAYPVLSVFLWIILWRVFSVPFKCFFCYRQAGSAMMEQYQAGAPASSRLKILLHFPVWVILLTCFRCEVLLVTLYFYHMETKMVNICTSEVPPGQVPSHLLLEGLVRLLILLDIYLHIRK